MRQAQISSIVGEESKAQEAFLIRFETSQTLPRLGGNSGPPFPTTPFLIGIVMSTEKFTARQIKNAIKENVPEKDRKNLPNIKTAMTAKDIKSTIGRVLSNPYVNGILTYLSLTGTAVKDGGKIKRKYAGKSLADIYNLEP